MKQYEKIILSVFVLLLFIGCTKEVVQDIVENTSTPMVEGPAVVEDVIEPEIIDEVMIEEAVFKIVNIYRYSIDPVSLEINKGDTVKWINLDDRLHKVTFKETWDIRSENLEEGESYTHTFNKVGIYTSLDVPFGMRGTIIVR